MAKTQDQLNPAYFDLVKARTEGGQKLDCLEQTAWLLAGADPAPESVLDVGCASGYLCGYLPPGLEYHGIDNSERYVEYGRGVLGPRGAHLHLGDGLSHEFGRRFDAVACLGLFYTFADFRAPLARLMNLARRMIVIRALFAQRGEIRYVPCLPGSDDYCYYNIFAYGDITGFCLERGWSAAWHNDWYVQSQGGAYETAGQDFPFKFLVLQRLPQTLSQAGPSQWGEDK